MRDPEWMDGDDFARMTEIPEDYFEEDNGFDEVEDDLGEPDEMWDEVFEFDD